MDIAQAIRAAAERYGVDPNYMLRTAQIESGLNPAAANPNSSARGVYQFVAPTWQQYGYGADPTDAAANIDAGARFTLDNRNALRNALGRDPTPGELYLAHQQGVGGALKMIQNPATPVSGQAVTLNAGHEGMTGGDFAQMWAQRFGGGASAQPATSTAVAENAPRARRFAQPGLDLAPLAEAFQRLAAQQVPQRHKRPGGPLVLS